MSNLLPRVVLSPMIPGESRTPSLQSKLTETVLKEKQKTVFDAAMEAMADGY